MTSKSRAVIYLLLFLSVLVLLFLLLWQILVVKQRQITEAAYPTSGIMPAYCESSSNSVVRYDAAVSALDLNGDGQLDTFGLDMRRSGSPDVLVFTGDFDQFSLSSLLSGFTSTASQQNVADTVAALLLYQSVFNYPQKIDVVEQTLSSPNLISDIEKYYSKSFGKLTEEEVTNYAQLNFLYLDSSKLVSLRNLYEDLNRIVSASRAFPYLAGSFEGRYISCQALRLEQFRG